MAEQAEDDVPDFEHAGLRRVDADADQDGAGRKQERLGELQML